MKMLFKIFLISYFLSSFLMCQDRFYWGDAPASGSKIYSLKFFDSNNGIAESKSGEMLKTTDSGDHWILNEGKDLGNVPSKVLWSADIYCSVMRTNNGGVTWEPYLQEQQEHFCNVYFKDQNTGWKVAEEFLNKVVNTIDDYLKKDDIKSLLNQPHQCTEYYTNVDSGWAVGWCLNSFEN